MSKLRTVSYALESVKKQWLSIVAVAVVDIVVVVIIIVIRTAVEKFSVTDTRHVQPVEALQAKVLCDILKKVVHLVFKASSDSRVSASGAEDITENKLHVTQEGSRWEIGRARPGVCPSASASASASCTSPSTSTSTSAGAGAPTSASKSEQVRNTALGGRTIRVVIRTTGCRLSSGRTGCSSSYLDIPCDFNGDVLRIQFTFSKRRCKVCTNDALEKD